MRAWCKAFWTAFSESAGYRQVARDFHSPLNINPQKLRLGSDWNSDVQKLYSSGLGARQLFFGEESGATPNELFRGDSLERSHSANR